MATTDYDASTKKWRANFHFQGLYHTIFLGKVHARDVELFAAQLARLEDVRTRGEDPTPLMIAWLNGLPDHIYNQIFQSGLIDDFEQPWKHLPEQRLESVFEHPDEVVAYVIWDGARPLVKIGKSTGHLLLKRLKELQTGVAFKLRLMCLVCGDHERDLHARFRTDRIRGNGEWFRASEDLIREVVAHPNAYWMSPPDIAAICVLASIVAPPIRFHGCQFSDFSSLPSHITSPRSGSPDSHARSRTPAP